MSPLHDNSMRSRCRPSLGCAFLLISLYSRVSVPLKAQLIMRVIGKERELDPDPAHRSCWVTRSLPSITSCLSSFDHFTLSAAPVQGCYWWGVWPVKVGACLSCCVTGLSAEGGKTVERRVCQVLHWALKSSLNAASQHSISKALRSGFCNEICCYRCMSRLEEKWMIHVIEVNYWWGQSLLPGLCDVQLACFRRVWFAHLRSSSLQSWVPEGSS